ncbi:MAG: hypothetical protein II266_08430, partial [Clostridia bacterium]|nr:hypothetical protein [Clostridia bacterium]
GAGYLCEQDPTHMTFIARSTGRAYMEGHHLLPLKHQSQFDCSIDIYANVVCLCPICHRLLHFGQDSDRRYAAEKLFEKRSGEQFDFDTRHPWITDDECGWGSCYCDQQADLTMGNTFDYPVMHGKALAQMGYSYISANAYAIDTIADVDAVDLIMGKQKLTALGNDTTFKTFTPELKKLLTDYLTTGGNLLVSGAAARPCCRISLS